MQTTLTTASRSMTGRPRVADRLIPYFALGLGLLAAFFVVAYLRRLETTAADGLPTTNVVVADRDIAAGERIAASMVGLKDIPADAAVKGSATALEQVTDQTARYPIARGEQIIDLRLVSTAKVDALSFQIPMGLRGFAIPVNSTTSPAALVTPGDFVDVLTTVEGTFVQAPSVSPATSVNSQPNSGRVAVTVLQNVQVISVQRTRAAGGVPYDSSVRGAPPADAGVSYLTLAVTPDQAQVLALFSGQAGDMVVSLRPFGDARTQPLDPVPSPFQLDRLSQPKILAPPRAAS